MTERWIEITEASGTRRARLRPGLTRLGGGEVDVPLDGVGTDQLHVWDDPVRVVFVGAGARPRLGGAPFEERALQPAEIFEWAGASFRVEDGAEPVVATLEEIDATPATPEPGAPAGVVPTPPATPVVPGPALAVAEEEPAVARMRAGLLVDTGLADPGVVLQWQKAVVDGSFDADLCAHAIAASARTAGLEDGRLRERAGRILRDFLMAPTMRGARGASRRMRKATRGGLAFLLAQGIALGVYSLIVLVALLLLRVRDISFDGLLDRILLRN